MKYLILILAVVTLLFSKVEDKKLLENLKTYDDNLSVKKIDNNINKVVIKKDKKTKIDKLIQKVEKKAKNTKFTKAIKKEAPALK